VLEAALTPFTSLRTFFQALWKDTLSAQVFCGLPAEEIDNLFQSYMARLEHLVPELLLEEQLLFLTALMHRIKSFQTKGMESANHFTKINQASTAEKIMAWIEVHYMEPFELEKLAKTVHLSPNHVSTTFRQSVGSSISEYLAARRIRQACWLLRTSPLSVQEIGREIGLSNFSYFCQMFKKHVGLTPYQFRSSPFDPANGV
jgi:AraC family transcriptional regulator of arabinose operon